MGETLSLYKNTAQNVVQTAKEFGVPARKFLQALAPIALNPYNKNMLSTLVRAHANSNNEKKEYRPVSVAISTKSIVTQLAKEYDVHPSAIVEALLDIVMMPDNKAFVEMALSWKETIKEEGGETQ